MCRVLAYKGHPVILDDLLYEPEHSIIKQSYHATEMDEPLNGDGFGIGWYNPQIADDPAVFKSVRPAWNNQNLQYMTPKISSGCLFAHVRSASVGTVSRLNCHPFHHKNLLMMHNGGIKHFEEIRRDLLAGLSDPQFRTIEGQTDSEHIFALFLEHLSGISQEPKLQDYQDALKGTIGDIITLKEKRGLDEPSHLNLLITDGHLMIGSRYVTDSDTTPHSLHFARGDRFECENNMYALRDDEGRNQKAVLIVSEKLNKRGEEWKDVPANHFFTVDEEGTIEFSEV